MLGSHVVPRFYLEQFAVKTRRSSKTGHLWIYSKGTAARKGTPKSEGTENGYFALLLPSGEVDETLENRLAYVENRANDVLVMAPNECFVWDQRYRRTMAEYLGLMFARSRGRLEGSASVHGKVSKMMRQLLADGFFREIAVELSEKYSQTIGEDQLATIVEKLAEKNTTKQAIREAFVDEMLSNTQLISSQIARKPWQIWRATGSSEFVTSDTPVVTALDVNGELAPGFGFNIPGVLVFFPLNPYACLVVGIRGPEYQRVPAENVTKVNDLVIRFMRKHVYSRTQHLRIDQAVQQYGSQVQFGNNAFVIVGNYNDAFKRIIRNNLGL